MPADRTVQFIWITKRNEMCVSTLLFILFSSSLPLRWRNCWLLKCRIRPLVHMPINRAHSKRSWIKSSSRQELCFCRIRADNSSSFEAENKASVFVSFVVLERHWDTVWLDMECLLRLEGAGEQQCICGSCEGRMSHPFFLHCSSSVKQMSACFL